MNSAELLERREIALGALQIALSGPDEQTFDEQIRPIGIRIQTMREIFYFRRMGVAHGDGIFRARAFEKKL
jgi:hypothetical protein